MSPSEPRPVASARFQLGAAGLALGGLLVIHGWLLIHDPLLARDDRHILGYLHGASELFAELARGRLGLVLGYQPLRDLTYFADLAASASLGFGTFHLSNLLIWLALAWLVWRILSRLHGKGNLTVAAVALFSVHPVFVNSVAWVSARKHLLAATLILAATDQWLSSESAHPGEKRKKAFAGCFYALSILSHPIYVLWPGWAMLQRSLTTRKNPGGALGWIALLGTMGVAGALTWNYYVSTYPAFTGTAKLVHGSAGVALLAFGRYVFNLAVPIRLATTYYPGSWVNLAGLGIAVVLVAVSLSLVGWRRTSCSAGFFLFPLLPVIAVANNVFVSDTYVLASAVAAWSLGLGILNALAARLTVPRAVQRTVALHAGFALLMLVMIGLSTRLASSWRSDQALWSHAYATEPSPRALAEEARFAMDASDLDRAGELVSRLRAWSPSDPALGYLEARLLHEDPGLDPETRSARLRELRASLPDDEWVRYFLAISLVRRGFIAQACQEYRASLDAPRAFGSERADVEQETRDVCARSASPGKSGGDRER